MHIRAYFCNIIIILALNVTSYVNYISTLHRIVITIDIALQDPYIESIKISRRWQRKINGLPWMCKISLLNDTIEFYSKVASYILLR